MLTSGNARAARVIIGLPAGVLMIKSNSEMPRSASWAEGGQPRRLNHCHAFAHALSGWNAQETCRLCMQLGAHFMTEKMSETPKLRDIS